MKNNESIFFLKKIKKIIIAVFLIVVTTATMAQHPFIHSITITDTAQNTKYQRIWRHNSDTAQINSFIHNSLSKYADNGYPFAKTLCDSVIIKEGKAIMFFSIHSGPLYKIGNIFLPASVKISKNYIYRTTFLRPNAVFSLKRLTRADALIEQTGILTTKQTSQVEFTPQCVDIYIYLEKLKANYAEAGIALMYDEIRSRYFPAGNAQLTLANTLGKGETFNFEWHGYKQNSQKLSSEIRLPYLFGTAMSAGGGAKIDKTDSTCVYVALNPMLEFALSDKLSIKTDIVSTWLIPQNDYSMITKTSSTLYGGDLIWLGVWNKNILKTTVGAAIGKRTFNNEKTPCQELRLSAHYNQTIISKLELETNAESKAKFCDAKTERQEKYRFGGAKSLRGFSENYFFADRYLILSNTLRYRPYKSFNLFAFYDIAFYRYESLNDTPQGTGIGVGLTQRNTVIDIAWALGREYGATLPLKQAKLHITLKVNF